jgi:16S rRNA (adenine1518-N6/adenine1519-N6)-dimethyltransferase
MTVYSFPTQRVVRGYLESEGLAPKKRWGQNFLIDEGYAKRIVDTLVTESSLRPPGTSVWEVGPGMGALTGLLLNAGHQVVAFEIDWGLIRILRERFAGDERLSIRQGDAAKSWHAELEEGGPPGAIVGNLPYRSASAIIGSYLEHRLMPPVCTFTVQREVADRLVAPSGTKAYSAFSVLVQSGMEVERRFDVPPGAFYPVPEVTSSVVRMSPRPPTLKPDEWALFLRMTRRVFQARRKVLRKSLAAFVAGERSTSVDLSEPGTLAESLVERCGIAREARPETVSPDGFVILARELHREFQPGPEQQG